MAQMTDGNNNTKIETLYIAMDLSKKTWVIAFGDGKKIRRQTVVARDLEGMKDAIKKEKYKLKLDDKCKVVSCYEAGRDGFWIHRWLKSIGVENNVVDAASIEKSSRKTAKTDRLDSEFLLRKLIQYYRDDDLKVWRVVNVPDEKVENERLSHRELQRLKKERSRLVTRLRSQLFSQGIVFDDNINGTFLTKFKKLRNWKKEPVTDSVKKEVLRLHGRIAQLELHIKEILDERALKLKSPETQIEKTAALLISLCGIGDTSAWLLASEFFGWRKFKNGRQVGSLAGLTGIPYASGDVHKESGITKAGNPRIRWIAIELAWSWTRWQPNSYLTKWFNERFGKDSGRMRRVGIVALARKLLVALWKFVDFGEVPNDAVMKR
jgi:transposase